ncbi:MAG: hypothetical protein EOR51_19880 [Mesorhizobium sp.]|nr:MAG: hypothetical protein EOR51_19880 [Mesorhizobium sp.]
MWREYQCPSTSGRVGSASSAQDVRLVRQFSQLPPVDLGEEFGAAGAEAMHLVGVEFGDEQADGGVQLRQGEQAMIAQPRWPTASIGHHHRRHGHAADDLRHSLFPPSTIG